MFPLIVSYYTIGTGYAEEIKNLISSCKKLALPYDITPIESQGQWDKNCCYKPQFLLKKLKTHNYPLLWVDADAIFLSKPTLFQTLNCDIALRTHDELPIDHPSKILTGTLYLKNSPPIYKLLSNWSAECQKMLQGKVEVWDQVALKHALLKGPSLNLFSLPDSYCFIYDKSLSPKEDAVILHYQASRLFKKVINKQISPFWESSMFSQKIRDEFSRE